MSVARVGLYGKIPAEGDFVRVAAGEPAVVAFDQWVQEALVRLGRSGGVLPNQPLYFAHRGQGSLLLGAMAPSRDTVGRVYPLIVFATVETADAVAHFPVLPDAFRGFLSAANAILAQSATMDLATLAARVRALSPPVDFASAETALRARLASTPGATWLSELFAGRVEGSAYYALRTALEACVTVRGKEPEKGSVVLDCPVHNEFDRYAWLEFARRTLRWRDASPSFYWREGKAPRLLVALGPPPPATLVSLARPEHKEPRVWSLRTEREESVVGAKQALTAAQRSAIGEAKGSLDALLADVAG